MKNIFLVDVDDTILDFHGVSADAFRAACLENGVAWSEELQRQYWVFNVSLWEALERKKLTREELMRERFVRFFQKLGLHDADGYAVNRSYIAYISNHPRYLPGAEDFLRKLSQAGRIFFVTNGTEDIQKSRFDIVGLWEKAENTFISQRIGYDKPAKAYTAYVFSHIPDFRREQAVWIGDSLSADMRAAWEAEVTGIWFNPQGKANTSGVQPDYEASSFEEILEILGKFTQNP